jgi:hypothetical protein
MTLTEMITIGMGQVLRNYTTENGINDTNTTTEQEVKWIELVQDMAKLMEEIIQNNNIKVEKIELPMPYVLTMLDALQAIKKHKLYSLMGDAKDTEEYVDIVIEEFLEPIAMSTGEIEIVFYD